MRTEPGPHPGRWVRLWQPGWGSNSRRTQLGAREFGSQGQVRRAGPIRVRSTHAVGRTTRKPGKILESVKSASVSAETIERIPLIAPFTKGSFRCESGRKALAVWFRGSPSSLVLLVTVPAGAVRAGGGGVGPINRSMGGAATAAPLDSAGALYWNPATIGALPSNRDGVRHRDPDPADDAHLARPRRGARQRPAGDHMRGTPAATTGSSSCPIDRPGLQADEDSPLTFGIGVFEIGGFGVNYPVSHDQPDPQPRVPVRPGGRAALHAAPALPVQPDGRPEARPTSCRSAPRPTSTTACSTLNPALSSVPSLVQTPARPGAVYASGHQGRSRAGGGFQVGVYYNPDEDWSFGASIKSPQWFDTYRFNSVNPTNGHAADPELNIDFPLTASVGLRLQGDRSAALGHRLPVPRLPRHQRLPPRRVRQPDGALRGLGWQNIFAPGDRASSTSGPTPSRPGSATPSTSTRSAPAMTDVQHRLAADHPALGRLGGSYNVTKAFKLSRGLRPRLPELDQRPDRRAVRRQGPRQLGPDRRHGRHRHLGRGVIFSVSARKTCNEFSTTRSGSSSLLKPYQCTGSLVFR